MGRTGTVCVITYQLEEPQLFLSRIFKVVNLWETCCKLVVITVVNLSNGIAAGRSGKKDKRERLEQERRESRLRMKER